MKKILLSALILLFAAGLWAGQSAVPTDQKAPASAAPAAEQKENTQTALTGSALLDLFIDSLSAMTGTGTPADAEKKVQEMMFAARKAREANRIDAVFFNRFNRVLAVTKLVITPDAGGILAPIVDDVLSAFVSDKLGHRGFDREGGKGAKAVNYVAQALSVEIIDLQIYLYSAKDRAKLQKDLEARMMNRPKK